MSAVDWSVGGTITEAHMKQFYALMQQHRTPEQAQQDQEAQEKLDAVHRADGRTVEERWEEKAAQMRFRGRIFGYPECCVDAFVESARNGGPGGGSLPMDATRSYVLCPACADA